MSRKPPPAKRPTYDDAQRARALELYGAEGLAAAHRELGIPKPTIVRWARTAGVTSAEQAAADRARTEAATRAAQLELARRVAEGRAALVPKLVAVANAALDSTVAILEAQRAVEKDAAANEGGLVKSALTSRRAVINDGPPLRAIVGAGTRAIHDLQLLTGEETERGPSGQVTVVFATPPPGDEPAPRIIDLEPDVRAVTG